MTSQWSGVECFSSRIQGLREPMSILFLYNLNIRVPIDNESTADSYRNGRLKNP